MASSNRVFVSPGVYTSEKDLTFVAQSVGVTTLGLVGEALKGPAFEPILITNFDEYKTYFGTTSPIKYGNDYPKYEMAYVAKSYLQESNQLFVTRVLGKTGYKPNKSFGIQTLGGVEIDITSYSQSGTTLDPLDVSSSSLFVELSGKTAFDGTSITTYIEREYSGNTSGNTGQWFVIGDIPTTGVTALTSSLEEVSPLTNKTNSTNNNNKEWYNVFFTKSGVTDSTITGVFSYLFVYNSGSSVFDVTRYEYSASLNVDYAGVVVASLRSRGVYVGETLSLEITGNTKFLISETDDIETNPLGNFVINATGSTSGAVSFGVSLDTTSSKYITKVLGVDVFDKDRSEFPLYVHEVYPNLLKSLYDKGLVRGISLDELYETESDNFLREWDTANSPMVVSEVRGGKVDDLFQVLTISDGEDSNFQVKITIQNIDLDSGDFDLVVRDFNDTDDNVVVLEKFTRCNMNHDVPGYVARKVGTSDGEYELRSKYIMLLMAENHPYDAFPAGFKGFTVNSSFGSGGVLGSVYFKTKYHISGDVFRYDSDGTPNIESSDKVRKSYLGLSSQNGYKFDKDLFKFKGVNSSGVSYGFHMSKNASGITGNTLSGYQFQSTTYDLEGTSKGLLESILYRKFTFAVCGGFDGWDIYRQNRTNTDAYIFGKTKYISGHTTNGGVFSSSVGNSDYYAFLDGINKYSNPEAVDINVFSTPGINFYDHSSLVSEAIDMIENDRADSLYVIGSRNVTTSDEVIDDLDSVSLDSSYSATYWPWIQVRDVENSTQLYIPPTGEVLKNIALTDNVSYPWFAVAGYSRGLVNAIKAQKKLTLDERDDLYKARINPIATYSDTGTIIWGNKTLQVRESALDRINVRRLLLRARKLISAVAVRLLFEQNDEQVRNEFLRLVNPILENIKKERGLTDFRVTVSNDPEDLDSNTLRGKIYIKPTRSLEFIDVEFIITPTGASFENI